MRKSQSLRCLCSCVQATERVVERRPRRSGSCSSESSHEQSDAVKRTVAAVKRLYHSDFNQVESRRYSLLAPPGSLALGWEGPPAVSSRRGGSRLFYSSQWERWLHFTRLRNLHRQDETGATICGEIDSFNIATEGGIIATYALHYRISL